MNIWIMKIVREKDSRTILKHINFFFCGRNAFHELSGLSSGAGEDDIHQLKTVSVTVKNLKFSHSLFYTILWKLLGSVKYLISELALLCVEPDQKPADTWLCPSGKEYLQRNKSCTQEKQYKCMTKTRIYSSLNYSDAIWKRNYCPRKKEITAP